MARHKQFNREEVLDRAVETFWRRGYKATSMQNLVEDMGINRQSLYDTFGGKRQLFLRALDRYRQKTEAEMHSLFERPGSVKNAFREMFDGIVEESVTNTNLRGCFINNTMIELAAHDEEAAKIVAANAVASEKAFHRALNEARKAGEISDEHDLLALARFLYNSMHGLRVMARATSDRKVLQDIVNVTLSTLD